MSANSFELPQSSNRFKLSVMMFLEFFIWGAWLPKIFGYLDTLHFAPWQQGLILNAFAVASLAAMSGKVSKRPCIAPFRLTRP